MWRVMGGLFFLSLSLMTLVLSFIGPMVALAAAIFCLFNDRFLPALVWIVLAWIGGKACIKVSALFTRLAHWSVGVPDKAVRHV